jgi:hypothetical protein
MCFYRWTIRQFLGFECEEAVYTKLRNVELSDISILWNNLVASKLWARGGGEIELIMIVLDKCVNIWRGVLGWLGVTKWGCILSWAGLSRGIGLNDGSGVWRKRDGSGRKWWELNIED